MGDDRETLPRTIEPTLRRHIQSCGNYGPMVICTVLEVERTKRERRYNRATIPTWSFASNLLVASLWTAVIGCYPDRTTSLLADHIVSVMGCLDFSTNDNQKWSRIWSNNFKRFKWKEWFPIRVGRLTFDQSSLTFCFSYHVIELPIPTRILSIILPIFSLILCLTIYFVAMSVKFSSLLLEHRSKSPKYCI